MSAQPQIRPAQKDDIPSLVTLLWELFSQEDEFTPNTENQIRGLSDILNNHHTGLILTARLNDRIVGMVILLFTVSTALGAKVALLEDMVVSSEYRHQGIGSLLLNSAIEYAQNAQCKRITLLTDSDNQIAHQFYQQHNFHPSKMQPFRLFLDSHE